MNRCKNRLDPLIRIATPLALTVLLGVAWITAGPDSLRAQAQEHCMGPREVFGPCVDLAHRYNGVCEGSKCYPGHEMCCLEEIFVIVRR